MSSGDSTSRLTSALGLVAVVGVLASLLGLVVSLATTNGLLLGSSWQTAALVSTAIVVVTLLLVVLAGKPSGRWRRTPYW